MASLKESEHLSLPFQIIEVATKNFSTLIGKGGYGHVYKGELSLSGELTTVAVKRLQLNNLSGQGLNEFLTEIQLLSRYKHPNLVSLLGYCEERKEKVLIYEYAHRGSLEKYLRNAQNFICTLTWRQRLNICIDAARGLDYLHNHVADHQRVIHRDIKSANILLDHNWKAMIADLGLSKLGRANEKDTFLVTNACGTEGYCDPAYRQTGVLTKESDVYSFGVVLFEVLCGRLCFEPNLESKQRLLPLLAQRYYRKEKLYQIIDPTLSEYKHTNSVKRFSRIAYQCLLEDRKGRPSMESVLQELEKALNMLENAEDGRRRRDDTVVEIRKNKREENLLKKRPVVPSSQPLSTGGAPVQTSTIEKKLESLPSMVAGVYSNDSNMQLEATTQLRKLLSIERSPPIEEVIQSGVVPRFVEFLMRGDYPQLQFEAAWALTNVASGTSENTKVVIDHGAVPFFVKLLASPSDDVREQAVWALGNVAGDSPRCRDLVLGQGALIPLLAQLNEHAKLSMLRNVAWTLSNFCRGKPQPPFELTKPALPALERLVHSNDEEVFTDACWALSYLSDGTNDKIQAVIEAGVCQRLIELLQHPSPSVLIPVLRTVGNIVTGDDLQTQYIIEQGALPLLQNLLTDNHKKSIKKNACLTISNITAGNNTQIQAVIEAGLIAPLVNLLQTAEFDIKKEAAWAISCATSGGNNEQIKYLVSQGCIKPLCDLLVCSDTKIVTVCLEGLKNILEVGEVEKNLGHGGDVNYYAQMIDDAEGLEKIENLQSHDNNEIYEKAIKILKTYWLEKEEATVEDVEQPRFHFVGTIQVPSGGFRSRLARLFRSEHPK